MAIIHKLVESGAEDYLPFLLARERVIRKQREDNPDGSMSGGYAVKYELGDGIEGELRMVGNQSFIRLTKGAAKKWIALACNSVYRFSDANIIKVIQAPEGTPPDAPVRPTPIIYPEFEYTAPTAGWVTCNLSNPLCSAGVIGGTDRMSELYAEASAALTGVTLAYYAEVFPSIVFPPGWAAPPSGLGPVACQLPPGGGPCDWEVWDFVYAWSAGPYYEAYTAWHAGLRAAQAQQEALDAAYSQALAAYQEAMRIYNEAIYAARKRAIDAATQEGRVNQIASVMAEQGTGLMSQLVSMAVLRPNYIPKETPIEEFCSFTQSPGMGHTDIAQSFWAKPDRVGVDGKGTFATGLSSLPNETEQIGIVLDDVYATAQVSIDDMLFDGFPTMGASGFGYLVSGPMGMPINAATDAANIDIEPVASYPGWYFSERIAARDENKQLRTALLPISFDIIPPGAASAFYFVFFEFYAYDFVAAEWRWLPSLHLQTHHSAAMVYRSGAVHTSANFRVPDPNTPSLDASVQSIRSRLFIKQTVDASGVIAAPTEIKVVDGERIQFDLANYPGVTRADLSDFLTVAVGTSKWAEPVEPEPRTAIGKTDFQDFAATDPGSAFMLQLHKSCMNKLQISTQ